MAEISCVDCGDAVTHQCDDCGEFLCSSHVEKVHEVETNTHWQLCDVCFEKKFDKE
jgi:hypothetical protein